MRYQTLSEWLEWQETLHPQNIELGLDRIQQVFRRLQPQKNPFTLITVAGTNGKGSTVALLEAAFSNAGFRTGAYTSPHILRYNERIRLDSQEVTDELICKAFQRVDEARGDISLTYFEFGTLAALDIFYQHNPDVVILEVGLGGRLDAVNILDPDIAIITSIGLDHTDWLGNDRESIAREKAGIMRKARPVICSEIDIPQNIYTVANELGSELYCLGQEFAYEKKTDSWCWRGINGQETSLPFPALSGEHQLRNASAVMTALEILANQYPVSYEHIQQALTTTQVPGRQQYIQGKYSWILDVAHNEQGLRALADNLVDQQQTTRAVVGMLKDKDLPACLERMRQVVSHWYCVDLDVPRGASSEDLQAVLTDLGETASVSCFENVASAMDCAENQSEETDRLLVFGSFYTVAEALQRGV